MDKVLITTSSFGETGSDPFANMRGEKINIVFNPYGRRLTEGEAKDLLEKHQPVGMIAGVEPLNADFFRLAKRLKIVSRCGAGLDSVDVGAAEEMGIVVTSTPDAVTVPVAELTLGLILSLLRNIHIADRSVRNGGWERPMGSLLHRKVVGIIGMGRIGKYMAGLMAPFGCRLLGFDQEIAENDRCAIVGLDELLSESDIVTLHIPYSRENHHFISASEMSKMKEGAFLINAARGGLVNEEALFEVLKSKKLSGAALDCFEEEPYSGNLKGLENVLLTSHIGSYAREAREEMELEAVENLLRELKRAGVIR